MRTIRFIALLSAVPLSSFSQAFLSPKSKGSVSILYQYSIDRLHAFSDGSTRDTGHMFWNTVALDTDYSITDRLAVRASLPFVAGQYVGTHPHQVIRGDATTNVALDNGVYHGTVTDFRFGVRYSLTKGELKVVPDFQATIPAHPYPVFLHALRRNSVEMDPVLPVQALEIRQPQVSFMYQGSRLQRVIRPLVSHMPAGAAVQLGVNDRRQFVERALISAAPSAQQLGNFLGRSRIPIAVP